MKKQLHTEIINLLKDLHKDYPNQPLAFHIGIATADLDLTLITDKTFKDALLKYTLEKELDASFIPVREDIFTLEEEEDEDF